MENIMTAEEYFEMATANTKETRLQVCAEECIALMNDFAEQFSESGVAGVRCWNEMESAKIIAGVILIGYIENNNLRDIFSNKIKLNKVKSALRKLAKQLILNESI